ncbi:MAG: sigma-70 family RNA polymerase sigma factor [Chloroflexia bacterium]|nr:sigma-70 family RNA polymerase sigma factor [Chloroflexia bacterium]
MLKANTINLTEMVETYTRELYSWALHKVSDSELAKDLVQDTFLSAYKAKDSFKGESTEKTWLTRILNNKIIDYYRKKNPESSLTDYLQDTQDKFNDMFFESQGFRKGHFKPLIGNYGWHDTTEKKINSEEFEQILQQCIAKIPPKLAPIFVAKFIEEEEKISAPTLLSALPLVSRSIIVGDPGFIVEEKHFIGVNSKFPGAKNHCSIKFIFILKLRR